MFPGFICLTGKGQHLVTVEIVCHLDFGVSHPFLSESLTAQLQGIIFMTSICLWISLSNIGSQRETNGKHILTEICLLEFKRSLGTFDEKIR